MRPPAPRSRAWTSLTVSKPSPLLPAGESASGLRWAPTHRSASVRGRLQRNLRPDGHRALARQTEVLDRTGGVARHRDEQPLAPGPLAPGGGRRDGDAGDEVRGVLEVEVAFDEAVLAAQAKRARHVDGVLVAETNGDVGDLEPPVAQDLHGEAVVLVDVGDAHRLDGHDED